MARFMWAAFPVRGGYPPLTIPRTGPGGESYRGMASAQVMPGRLRDGSR